MNQICGNICYMLYILNIFTVCIYSTLLFNISAKQYTWLIVLISSIFLQNYYLWCIRKQIYQERFNYIQSGTVAHLPDVQQEETECHVSVSFYHPMLSQVYNAHVYLLLKRFQRIWSITVAPMWDVKIESICWSVNAWRCLVRDNTAQQLQINTLINFSLELSML